VLKDLADFRLLKSIRSPQSRYWIRLQVKEVCGGKELCCEGGDISLPSAPPFVCVENAGGKHGAALLAGQAALSIPGYIAFE